ASRPPFPVPPPRVSHAAPPPLPGPNPWIPCLFLAHHFPYPRDQTAPRACLGAGLLASSTPNGHRSLPGSVAPLPAARIASAPLPGPVAPLPAARLARPPPLRGLPRLFPRIPAGRGHRPAVPAPCRYRAGDRP